MNQEKNERLRIFVSHAAADREPARKLSNTLAQRHGVRVFDPETLSAGEDWQAKLKDELINSDVFVVLVSPEAMASAHVLQEIGAAWALSKPVVSVLKDSYREFDVPGSLSDQFMVELDDLDNPNVMNQVLGRYRKGAGLDAEA